MRLLTGAVAPVAPAERPRPSGPNQKNSSKRCEVYLRRRKKRPACGTRRWPCCAARGKHHFCRARILQRPPRPSLAGLGHSRPPARSSPRTLPVFPAKKRKILAFFPEKKRIFFRFLDDFFWFWFGQSATRLWAPKFAKLLVNPWYHGLTNNFGFFSCRKLGKKIDFFQEKQGNFFDFFSEKKRKIFRFFLEKKRNFFDFFEPTGWKKNHQKNTKRYRKKRPSFSTFLQKEK